MNNHKYHSPGATLLVSLLILLPSFLASADEERDLLLKRSAECRDAMIVASLNDWETCGCFIGNDGLAVFQLVTFAGPKMPEKFSLSIDKQLNAPTIRHIDPELGIVFVKFNHRPKSWLEPSAEPIQLGEQVSILHPNSEGVAAIGPIISRSKTIEVRFLRPIYKPFISIAAGLPAGRKFPVAGGAPVIDSKGLLRGIFLETRFIGSQTFLGASPADRWIAGIAKAREAKKAVAHPFHRDPFDPASRHPDYIKTMQAVANKDFKLAITHVQSALKVYPKSSILLSLHFNLSDSANAGDLLALAEMTKPPESGTAAEHVIYYGNLLSAYKQKGDSDGVEKAFREGMKHAPPEDSNLRRYYAGWLESEGRFEEALRYFQEAAKASPDNIQLLERSASLLIRLKNWKKEKEVTTRIRELYKLYRLTTPSQLRLKSQ